MVRLSVVVPMFNAERFVDSCFEILDRQGLERSEFEVVVVDDGAQPFVLCECKAPEIAIDRHVLAQAVRYNSVLKARYLILTNGLAHYCYELSDGNYRRCEHFPQFSAGMAER